MLQRTMFTLVLFVQDWEESDADVVRAMQAAMIASQATDSKSLLKTRAAAGSIDGRVGSNSPSPNSRCADASARCNEMIPEAACCVLHVHSLCDCAI